MFEITIKTKNGELMRQYDSVEKIDWNEEIQEMYNRNEELSV